MDINYELYKVFYHVAVTLSFSEASKQLFISQSAVSQSIKVLEKKLNQTLFIRSTKKVQLTPEGEILLKHIEPAMNLIKRGENQLLEANTLNGGQLRIGASDTICRYYLVPFFREFHLKYPNVHIKVANQTSIACAKMLENGQVDFIITNYPNSSLSNVQSIRSLREFSDVRGKPGAFPLRGTKNRPAGTADLSHPHAGPQEYDQRIFTSYVPEKPAGPGAGDRAHQQRPAHRPGPHRPGHRLRTGFLHPEGR